jgi:hypothetical protein
MKKTLVCAALVVISIFAGRVIKARAGTSAAPQQQRPATACTVPKKFGVFKGGLAGLLMFEDASANIFAVECPALAPGPAQVRFIVNRN